MTAQLADPAFWSANATYQKLAHDFTRVFGARAWQHAAVAPGSTVLDIAAGTGALALVAAAAGARVLATDFSPGMVDTVQSYGIANLQARVMDGQALDLPDASFDAAFSLFGIMLFPDWRAGLSEMARVVRTGGTGCVASWKDPSGAAANLLLARLCAALFPELPQPEPLAGMQALGTSARFDAALRAVGFTDVSIIEVTHDYPIDAVAFAEPDRLFQFSPLWPDLGEARRGAILTTIEAALVARGGALPVPSPALIGSGRRA